jgi:hypothetical protein
MQNTIIATAKSNAIDSTYLVTGSGNATDWMRARAQNARRDIMDGYTPTDEYEAVAAYFNGIGDALRELASIEAGTK